MPTGTKAHVSPEAGGARAGQVERHTSLISSFQAGHGAADPEAETVYGEEPA